MNKKVLILGANGLIGNGLTRYFSTKDIYLIAVVRSKMKRFQEKINYAYCKNLNSIKSFNSISKIINQSKPDFVINCIGVTKHYKNKSKKLLNI